MSFHSPFFFLSIILVDNMYTVMSLFCSTE
nr:MAG TPA: hypothetical protein [Caudoviricetes sp.]